MAGSIILSDDYWLVGLSFTNYIDTDLKPEGIDVDDLRPESVVAMDLRPTSGTVASDEDDPENRPTSLGAEELRPVGRTHQLRPTSLKVEEEI